ncbi:hypothetical protein VPHG_00102 [Vibrio phage 11895-B1]|uniref:hypothetical protein n=1 Tax=Vibrio phage 11895-B1 TaxID=754075 RepID=UPI0002C138EA|nr:hypothetical protein VPHG_00102 [Vibrio phage 11895-B1]AGH32169.1 hypothetical protein VPHG_00102 [Vibrio phage 11895-B1]
MAKAAQDAGISISGSVKEMMELQQRGELISAKVLPFFAQRMHEAAVANGGLENALNSNRVAMNRMVTSFQMAGDAMFKSGFGEGLTELFNSIGDMISDNMPLWKALGKIVGGVLSGLADVIDTIIAPALSALGSIFHALTKLFGDFSGWIAAIILRFGVFGQIISKVWGVLGGGKSVVGALIRVFSKFLIPIQFALGLLEEIAEFFAPTGKRTLIGTNINKIFESEAFNKFTNTVSAFVKGISDLPSAQQQQSVDKVQRLNTVKPFSYGTPPPQQINVTGDVYLDSQLVGQQVMGTEAAKSAIDSRVGDYTMRRY